MPPPIMSAPNPKIRRALHLTKCTHSQRTPNNIPGRITLITNTAPRRHMPLPLPNIPIAIAPQQSTHLHTAPSHTATMQWPKVRFLPVEGGLQHNDIISQEAINFLTNYVWVISLDIYMPTKLMPTSAPTCLNHEQVAMPMVHPITGETISSYKWLMRDPTTAETWKTAFGKDFGSKQGKKALTQSLS
jgi:hypothetical protein